MENRKKDLLIVTSSIYNLFNTGVSKDGYLKTGDSEGMDSYYWSL